VVVFLAFRYVALTLALGVVALLTSLADRWSTNDSHSSSTAATSESCKSST